MDNVMTLAEFAAVMALSLGLALGLEWLCLRGAFLLLPSPARAQRRGTASRSAARRPSPAWARVPHKGWPRLGRAGLDR